MPVKPLVICKNIIVFYAMLLIMSTGFSVAAHAGALRYFMRGGTRSLAMGGMPALASGVSDYLPEHPALEMQRPDFSLRFSAEYEDIARTEEDGVPTSDVSARANNIELVLNDEDERHRITFMALFRNEISSSYDIGNGTYIRTTGEPRLFSAAMRTGKIAIGAGRGESDAAISGFSDYLKQEVFDSAGPPVYEGGTRQPESFIELAYIHSDHMQFFYKRSWAEKSLSLTISGDDPATGRWQLDMPWNLEGGSRSAGTIVELGDRLTMTVSDTRYFFYGRDISVLTYSDGLGTYNPFGTHKTSLHSKSTAVGIDYRKSDATLLTFGFAQSRMDVFYDGKFIAVPTGFYDVEGGLYLKPALFSIGMEKEGAIYGTTFRAGLQYGNLHPGGGIAVSGNACPFLIDCKQTSYDEWLMPYTSITQRALTLGLERRVGRFNIAYALGQMFPKAVRRADEDSTGGSREGNNIQAKGKEGRGGMLHVFSIETTF